MSELPGDLKEIIESCLNILPKDRPTCEELFEKDIFNQYKNTLATNKSNTYEPFEIFTINELYHWWQLAGGDVLQELKKQGLIRSSPPILSLPQ
ncbi:hypothetical protein NQ314_015585 [Rhamnusium bicolor]|uniref:Uncharacterized protein n=1 Tax=Rhamnusium bicolor TaxID=1586634 RepID=A0AAV8WZ60_9CUCU|nr:hypothetical protein NQ314_015585 [Rhamnusium bicolor]